MSKLLSVTPHGAAVLGPLLDDPGPLLGWLSCLTEKGRLGCFEYPVAPPRELLAWFIEHPEELEWPASASYSSDTAKWRRSLSDDDPPGSRTDAQQQARELVATRPPSAREWWRFEGTSMLDCVLMTDRLVITIEGKRTEPLSAATSWYPARSQLVRNIEAAKQLGQGRRWASLLLCETEILEGSDAGLDAVLPASAPHLDEVQRSELKGAYLGNVTWQHACDATGLDFDSLPCTTQDIQS